MNSGVKPASNRRDRRKVTYRTDDIIELVQEVLYTDADDTIGLSRRYTPTLLGMQRLFYDVGRRITYVEDPAGYQWVQTPSFLWHESRRGDCKSITVFISSVLQNMGVEHIIRYTSYDMMGMLSKRFTHVYPVAILDGREIPLDVVYLKQEGGRFGTEKPYSRKKDIVVEPGLYKIGNVGLTPAEEQYVKDVQATMAEMGQAMADIPDSVITSGPGDITKMTQGQLDREIWRDRFEIYAKQEASPARRQKYRDAAQAMTTGQVAGIYGLDGDPLGRQVQQILNSSTSNKPAFEDFTLVLTNAPSPEISGLFKKIGGFFKDVGNWFKDQFNKFVNWIWKGPAKSMGPYFLFLFAKKDRVKSPEMRRRIAQQEKNFQYIIKKGKFSENQLKGVLLNGIKEQTGTDPATLFKTAKAPKIAAFPAISVLLAKVAAFVIKAIGFVIKVVQKIVGLFKGKKDDAGQIDEASSSDPNLLLEEARLQEEAESNSPSKPGSQQGGGGFGIAAGALALLAVPLLL